MTIYELTIDQLITVYQYWLMDLVNTNKITWETMNNHLYDDIEKHLKALYRVHKNVVFSTDDF